MKNITLPPELAASVASDNKDFAVKAGRAKPLKKSFSSILFGTVWTALTGFFIYGFVGPLLQGQEVHFESNGVPMVASPDNLDSLITPAIFLGVFVLIGLGILSSGIYSLFKKGGYFVGTPNRLVNFNNAKLRSIDWEQFTGNIEVSGNAQKGNISLQMRTGKLVNRKKGPARYVPDSIYISEIPNAYAIAKICRKRIKENDPTPAATSPHLT